MAEDLETLQERIAHLERAVEDLSDALARQDRALDQVERRLALLIQREAQASGGALFGDERPPHY